MIERVEVDGAVIVVGPDAARGRRGGAGRGRAGRAGRGDDRLDGRSGVPAALDEMVEELYGLGDSNS